MPVNIFRLPGNNPYLNLAFEEYILTEFEKKPEDVFLVFYENSDSIILGKNLEYNKEVFPHKNHPPVLRRLSGGGSVVHFQGNLNYGLIVNTEEYTDFKLISDSYDVILNTLSKSLSGKINIVPGGISDLCIESVKGRKKISGNSQVRKRNWLLHHGTLLYNTRNLPLISYYLKHPPKEPDYRKGLNHRDFMVKYLPKQHHTELIKKISAAFSSYFNQSVNYKPVTKEILSRARNYYNTNASTRLNVTPL